MTAPRRVPIEWNEAVQVGWAEELPDGTLWVTFPGYSGRPVSTSMEKQIRRILNGEEEGPP